MRAVVTALGREATSLARCAARYPLGLVEGALTTGRPSGDAAHDTPVLLVHGYGHNRSGWVMLDRRLRRAGFTSVHTCNYLPIGRDIPELAADVASRVRLIQQVTGAPKVHVVGHSLGGVLLRWFVQELGGDEVVDTAVTVASPHAGTEAARIGIGRTAGQLKPGSWVIRRLESGARPSPVRWVAVWSNMDVLVQPSSSAMLLHPAMRATNIYVPNHGHLGLMVSPVVARTITAQLEAAEGVAGVGRLLPMPAA